MNNIRYALASISYHKKLSFFISLFFFVFFFLLTSILNLIDISQNSFSQLEKINPKSDYLVHNSELLTSYYTLFSFVLILFILIFSVLTIFSILIKKQDFFKWRLMGLSLPSILKQYLLEILLLIMIGAFSSAFFMMIFQHTYEEILIACGNFFTEVTNRDYTFFSANPIIETTPNMSLNPISATTHFFNLDLASLPGTMVTKALQKNIFLISFLAMIISSTSLASFLLTNKKHQI